MIYTVTLKAKDILFLISQGIITIDKLINANTKGDEITDEDKKLYKMKVLHVIENDSFYVKFYNQLNLLDEETGLLVLNSMDIYDLQDVKEYDIPQSHIDFINDKFNDEEKSKLKNHWLNKYINISFIPKSTKNIKEIKFINDIPYITLQFYSSDNISFKNTTILGRGMSGILKGYFFRNIDEAKIIVDKMADLELQINIAKEKAIFNAGQIDNNTNYKFAYIPEITPILSEESETFDILLNDKIRTINTKFILDVNLNGSCEDIVYVKTKSIYKKEKLIEAAKILNVPIIDNSYIFEKDYDLVVNKANELYEINEKLKQDSIKEQKEFIEQNFDEYQKLVKEALNSNDLEGNLYKDDNGVIYVEITLSFNDGFVYIASNYHKDNTIEDCINWINSFDVNDIKVTSDFNNKYTLFKSKNLPKING